jgi:nucleoside 2-deoxyribosyltransferase
VNKLIYLAGPYSYNPDEAYEKHLRYAGLLMQPGTFVFSPIVHNHLLAKTHNLPTDYTYWQRYNKEMVIRCDELYVMAEEGLETSKGTQYEIEVAKEYNKPIRYTRFV